MKANTKLVIGIGKRWCSYTSNEELWWHDFTLHHTEATTDIGISVTSMVTKIQFGHCKTCA
jgi:hypothetical protein